MYTYAGGGGRGGGGTHIYVVFASLRARADTESQLELVNWSGSRARKVECVVELCGKSRRVRQVCFHEEAIVSISTILRISSERQCP